jgi:prepilin-type N-terminal cleavage/methylation domain-containing protein
LNNIGFKNTRVSKRKGFSLVELLMAMVMLTVFLFVVFALFPSAYKATAQARMVTMSSELAKQEMEGLITFLENADWDKPTTWTSAGWQSNGTEYSRTTKKTIRSNIKGIASDTEMIVESRIKNQAITVPVENGDPINSDAKYVTVEVRYIFGRTNDADVEKHGALIKTLVTRP